MRFAIVPALLFSLTTFALGETWSVLIDSQGSSWIDRIPSGGVVTSSYTSYPTPAGNLIVALDDRGDLMWHSVLLRPGEGAGGEAIIRPSADGGYCAVTTFYVAGSANAWLGKLDAVGRIVWQRAWAGGMGSASAEDVVASADGGCLFVGQVLRDGRTAIWVMRTDPSGTSVWSEGIDAPGNEGRGRARMLANGDFVVTALSVRGGSDSGLVVRLRPDGSIVWQRAIEGPTAVRLQAVATTSSGEILVGGALWNPGQGSGPSGALLVRLSASGTLLDSRLYRGPLEIHSIAPKSDGGLALAGPVFRYAGRNRQWDNLQWDGGFIIVTDAAGAPIAASTHGGPIADSLESIIESADGGLTVAGVGSRSTTFGQLLVEKTDALGYVGTACTRIVPRAIDVDASPISVRSSSAFVASFTPTPSPFLISNGDTNPPGTELLCSAP